jgi:hypothetical protein
LKIRSWIPILLLAVPISAYGHAEIIFPKLLSLDELPNTGFVLLNPEPYVANVNFYLFSAAGKVVSSSAPVRIGPRGQAAKLGSELFADPAV